MDTKAYADLKRLCRRNGFSVRENAFFRVHGDGILQIIKYSTVKQFSAYRIDYGLYSMYGELQPQCFTAAGCTARYSVLSHMEKQDAVLLSELGNNAYALSVVSPEKPVYLTEQYVIPFLDSITTQSQLTQALFQLDPRWDDAGKFDPLLKEGRYADAALVIRSVLEQHRNALENSHPQEDPHRFSSMYCRIVREDIGLMEKLEIALSEDSEAIQAYLSGNYAANCRNAQFTQLRLHKPAMLRSL